MRGGQRGSLQLVCQIWALKTNRFCLLTHERQSEADAGRGRSRLPGEPAWGGGPRGAEAHTRPLSPQAPPSWAWPCGHSPGAAPASVSLTPRCRVYRRSSRCTWAWTPRPRPSSWSGAPRTTATATPTSGASGRRAGSAFRVARKWSRPGSSRGRRASVRPRRAWPWPFLETLADMSASTPTTCLCILEMGVRHSSTCLRYPIGSQPVCWEKPCKSSSRTCWRR